MIESKQTNQYEWVLPLLTTPYRFIGKKPTAVLFGEERVVVKSWREVYTVILKRCNSDPKHHETLMWLRGKVAGKERIFLADSPDRMTRPTQIDDAMFAESHYGAATLIHILTVRLLAPVGFDCSKVNIVLKVENCQIS